MDFVIRKKGYFYILDVKGDCFNSALFDKLKYTIENLKRKKSIAINCKNIKNIESAPFVNYLNRTKVALFNLDAFAQTQLSLLNQKEFTDLYLDENDFLQGKRRLARRRFTLIKG